MTSDPVAVERAAESARSRKPVIHTWQGADPARLESVRALITETRLRASGRLIAAADPRTGSEPYSVSFDASFGATLVHADSAGRALLRTTTAEHERQLALTRTEEGVWLVDRGAEAERADFDGAVAVDVAGAVTFTTIPVRYLGLHHTDGEHELPVVSVSLPDLAITRVRHTYRTVARDADGVTLDLTRDGDTVRLRVDADGVVVDFPGIATRL